MNDNSNDNDHLDPDTITAMDGSDLDEKDIARVVQRDGLEGKGFTAVVKVGGEGPGFVIHCSGCGKAARLPKAPNPLPELVMCPSCMRARIAQLP